MLNAPSPAAQKLEQLRELFPTAIETYAQGRVRINASALQLALGPANPAGVQVEEDGFELRWVGIHVQFQTKLNGHGLTQLLPSLSAPTSSNAT